MSLGLEKLLLTSGAQKQNEEYWYYSRQVVKTNTPSRRLGMSFADESRIRRSATRFIGKLAEEVYHNWVTRCNGINIQLQSMLPGIITRVHTTASVWFHRFFMVHPMQIFDPYVISASAFYLASKVEDYPQSIAAIVFYTRQILELWGVEQEWNDIEDELVDLEHCIVKTLGFVIWVKHPHLYIQPFMNQLIGETEKLRKIQQIAVQYAHDSLGTTFCIRVNPRKLAIVFIAWACQQEQFPLDNWKNKGEKCTLTNWLHSFNIKEELVSELYQEYLEHTAKDKEEYTLLLSSFPSNSSRLSRSFHPGSSSGSSRSCSSSSPSPSFSSSSSRSSSSSCGSGTPANHRSTEFFNTKPSQNNNNNNENYHLNGEKKGNGAYSGSSFLPEVGSV